MPVFSPGPALIGHRGLGRGVVDGHPENSIDSVRAAARAGLPWVEIDVRRTADDALVVGHDTMTLDGREIAACSLAQVTDAGIRRVEEHLEALPDHVGVVFDIKTSLADALRPVATTTTALLCPLARAEMPRRRVVVYSFDPSTLPVLRELAPDVSRGMLTWFDFPFRKAVPAAVHLGAQVIAAHTGSFLGNRIEPQFSPGDVAGAVEVAHRAGLEVVAWCPTPKDGARLLEAGVDALCINDVPSAMDELAELGIRVPRPLPESPRQRST